MRSIDSVISLFRGKLADFIQEQNYDFDVIQTFITHSGKIQGFFSKGGFKDSEVILELENPSEKELEVWWKIPELFDEASQDIQINETFYFDFKIEFDGKKLILKK